MNKYREALNHIISCDREDCGVSNLSDAYRNDISALSELIKRYEDGELIEWHPYPQEKPTKTGVVYRTRCKGKETDQMYLGYDGFEFFIEGWAEMPKPYKEGR